MRKKIKFGILGCSSIAEKSMIPAIKNSTNSQLEMLGSQSTNKAAKFGKKFSCKVYGNYEEVLENDEIDAVYISLPPSLHEKWIIKAAKFGKHIICEKPTALSTKSAEKIIKECKKNHVRVIENFAFRYHPQQEKVLELIKKKSIGKISSFYGNYSFNLNVSQNNFRLNKKLGGGVLNDVAGYLICANRLIFNEKPISVFCNLQYERGIDVSGNIHIQYKDKNSICSFSYKNYFQSFYNIFGEKGVLKAEKSFNIRKDMKSVITIEKENKLKIINVKACDKFTKLTEIFCNEISNSNIKKNNFEKNIMDQANIMDAAKKSIFKKQIIKIK
jgi:D-xylose 1-dehydrogenase (NADP+, D-xylono-1,5-lactone-forming)